MVFHFGDDDLVAVTKNEALPPPGGNSRPRAAFTVALRNEYDARLRLSVAFLVNTSPRRGPNEFGNSPPCRFVGIR